MWRIGGRFAVDLWRFGQPDGDFGAAWGNGGRSCPQSDARCILSRSGLPALHPECLQGRYNSILRKATFFPLSDPVSFPFCISMPMLIVWQKSPFVTIQSVRFYRHLMRKNGRVPLQDPPVSFLMPRHHASLPPVHVLFDFWFSVLLFISWSCSSDSSRCTCQERSERSALRALLRRYPSPSQHQPGP